MASVTITDVSKTFGGQTALHAVDLEVPDGSFCCMLGSSGSGKSTLLRILAGLTAPDTGSVRIGDRDVTGLPSDKRRIGFVFQNYALFPHLSVGANVAFGLRVRGVSGKDAKVQADAMLKLVGLTDFGHRSPKQLSGGQQQRVALARALVTKPDVLLLDEPLSALDRKIRGEMQAEIKRLHIETGLTTLMVTHDQEEAMDLGDRVLMLSGGRVQQHDDPERLYRAPQNPFVAQFLGARPLGPGVVHRGSVESVVRVGSLELPLSRTDLADGADVSVLVMAESVSLRQDSDAGRTYSGILRSIDFYGPFVRAEIDAHGTVVPVTMLSKGVELLTVGERISFSIDTQGVHVYGGTENAA
jgi:ABC-type Fe3+/spermidine/putrescine transport system ATPase subunit